MTGHRQNSGVVEATGLTHWHAGLAAIPREFETVAGSSSLNRLMNMNESPFAKPDANLDFMSEISQRQEVFGTLFDTTFAVAPDTVLSKLFFQPLGIVDAGPFVSVGRAFRTRYGLEEGESSAEQVKVFISAESAVFLDLRLSSAASAEQIINCAAMMVREEALSGRSKTLGFLTVAPPADRERFWRDCGLRGPFIDRSFLSTRWARPQPGRVRELIEEKTRIASVLDRMKLAAISWTELQQAIAGIAGGLRQSEAGDQTLYRLLSGFLTELARHTRTGPA